MYNVLHKIHSSQRLIGVLTDGLGKIHPLQPHGIRSRVQHMRVTWRRETYRGRESSIEGEGRLQRGREVQPTQAHRGRDQGAYTGGGKPSLRMPIEKASLHRPIEGERILQRGAYRGIQREREAYRGRKKHRGREGENYREGQLGLRRERGAYKGRQAYRGREKEQINCHQSEIEKIPTSPPLGFIQNIQCKRIQYPPKY